MDIVMSFYNIFGVINTIFIFVSLYGVFSQLRLIWSRKAEKENNGATALLSNNQFTVSYLAYLSFFIYGYSIEPFNHFIVWPRLVAAVLVASILYEIWVDRKTKLALSSVFFVLLSLIVAVLGLFFGSSVVDQGKVISTVLILVISALIAQGYYHQIRLIIKSGSTGAVDLKMSQFIFMMDISTIAFALSMGLDTGWPLLVLAITSGITKIIMMYLFRWVRTSALALERANKCI